VEVLLLLLLLVVVTVVPGWGRLFVIGPRVPFVLSLRQSAHVVVVRPLHLLRP